ncbi:MAG: gamma-glutamylcyclotransferase family protein [Euryarchaeota archaeon]
MRVHVYVGRGGRLMLLPYEDEEEENRSILRFTVRREGDAIVVGPDDKLPKDLPPERVFAYGTLTDPETVASVVGRVPYMVYPAVLEGYELALEDVGNRYNTVREKEGSRVSGTLLVGLSEEELREVDRYEGYPVLYERRRERVETPLGEVGAYVYVARE